MNLRAFVVAWPLAHTRGSAGTRVWSVSDHETELPARTKVSLGSS